MLIVPSHRNIRIVCICNYDAPANLEIKIAQNWQNIVEESEKLGRHVFDGKILTANVVAHSHTTINIFCARSEFKNFCYQYAYGLEDHRTVYVSCLLRDRQGRYIWGRNDFSMTIMADDSLGCVGGTLRIDEDDIDYIQIKAYIQSKIECDLLQPTCVENLSFEGIYFDDLLVNVLFTAEYVGEEEIFKQGEFKGSVCLSRDEVLSQPGSFQPKLRRLIEREPDVF